MKRQNLSKCAAIVDHHHTTWSSLSLPNLDKTRPTRTQFIKKFSQCFPFCRKSKKERSVLKVEHNKVDVTAEIDLYPCPIGLNVPSEILSTAQIHQIEPHLPPICHGADWRLCFSTCQHGFTLAALYRKMNSVKNDLPVLIVIQDNDQHKFGALASNPLRVSDKFYGLGSTFLFKFLSPANLQVFKWSGDNFYFIKGDPDSIHFGAGGGKSGLWLDGDLNIGRTEPCQTFSSPSLVPNKGGDFTVKALEVWTFAW